MRNFNLKIAGLFLLFAVLFACNDSLEPRFERDTTISELAIANGGMDGKTVISGTYSSSDNTFVFEDVPAETDLQNIKFTGEISLGAAPEFQTYNFFETNPQIIKVINRDQSRDYNVKFNIMEPAMDPEINRVVVTLEDGVTDVPAEVSGNKDSLYLDAKNKDFVYLKSVEVLPKHASYEFTTIEGTRIYKENPGALKLDHMGRRKEYLIGFRYIPPTGVDFGKAVIYDYTANSALGKFPNGTAGYVRGGDFDGSSAHFPLRVNTARFDIANIIAKDISKVTTPTVPDPANADGYYGFAYFGANQAAVSGGHFYTMNMPTPGQWGAVAIHHWSNTGVAPTKTSLPLLVSDDSGTARFGDNMSLQLDENGNGYMFSLNNTLNKLMRIKITNYTTFSEMAFRTIGSGSQAGFANFNPVRVHKGEIGSGSANEYTYVTNNGLQLFDRDAVVLATIPLAKLPANLYNARIAEYNGARYMILLTKEIKMYVYDISDGKTTDEAMDKFAATLPLPLFEYSLGAFSGYGSVVATGVKNETLYILTSAGDTGSVVVELPKKVDE